MTITFYSKLRAELEICALHEERLKRSLKHLVPILPITPEFIEHAKDDDLAFLDMITMRFSKLQDALEKKVFPLILRLAGEYDEEETFIDRLNRLERLGVIDSMQHWQELRDIRNILSHEYENDLSKLCQTLNYFIDKSNDLLRIWEKVQQYISNKKLLSS